MPRKLRKRRETLWLQFEKKCYWCDCLTVFPESGCDNQPKADNLATVEHMRSKFHVERYEPNHTNEQRLVLACLACNGLRAKLEAKVVLSLNVKVTAKQGKAAAPSNTTSDTQLEEVLDENSKDIIV